MKEIKEKFKGNQEAQNRATAKLFEDADQNPLSGCFLSIAQLPVLLGLYRGIRLLAKDGELDEPFLWIPTLQGPVSPPDFRGMGWLTEGWVSDGSFPPTPQLGWETTLAFLIMPVVLVLGQSLTMSVLTPQMDDEGMSEDEKQQMSQTQGVLKFLPLMIGYFSLQVPAGLTIYWFVSNIFSLTQSLLVKGYYAANPPEIELPDYWDSLDDVDSMTSEEKRKAAEAGLNVGPTMDDLIDGTLPFSYKKTGYSGLSLFVLWLGCIVVSRILPQNRISTLSTAVMQSERTAKHGNVCWRDLVNSQQSWKNGLHKDRRHLLLLHQILRRNPPCNLQRHQQQPIEWN